MRGFNIKSSKHRLSLGMTIYVVSSVPVAGTDKWSLSMLSTVFSSVLITLHTDYDQPCGVNGNKVLGKKKKELSIFLLTDI